MLVNDDSDGRGDLEMVSSKRCEAIVDRIHFDFRNLVAGLTRSTPISLLVVRTYDFCQGAAG